MNKFVSFAIIFLCCISVPYSQRSKSMTKKRKSSAAGVEKVMSDSVQQSTVRNFDLDTISGVKNGDVFVGGSKVSLEDENGKKILGGAVLLKISGGKMKITKFTSIGAIDQMFFVDNSTGWITSIGDGTYKTTDGGETWTKLESSDTIRNVFFLDADTGWYFGIDRYFKSSVNGKVEKLKSFDYFHPVKKLQFLSPDSGWLQIVVDSKIRFQQTEDGGKNWTDVSIDGDEEVGDFQFINYFDGFAVGSRGLYKTVDAGKTWKSLKEQFKDGLYDRLFFVDRNVGWIIGDKSCSTQDGGQNWICRDFPKEMKKALSYIKGIVFTDVDNGWILTDEGLYFTKDGGRSWKRRLIILDKLKF